jgi:hypothetical protein
MENCRKMMRIDTNYDSEEDKEQRIHKTGKKTLKSMPQEEAESENEGRSKKDHKIEKVETEKEMETENVVVNNIVHEHTTTHETNMGTERRKEIEVIERKLKLCEREDSLPQHQHQQEKIRSELTRLAEGNAFSSSWFCCLFSASLVNSDRIFSCWCWC